MRNLLITSTIVISVFAGGAVASAQEVPPTEPEVRSQEVRAERVALVRHKSPRPLPSFWDRLAQCETGGDWKNRGNWAGGLGIARKTWAGYGGKSFAPTPDKATREEQIIIAERIAIDGYQTKNVFMTIDDKLKNRPFFRPAVGFGGWGALPCAGGVPHMVSYDPSTVVQQKFRWGQRGAVVVDLQTILRVNRSGVYDARTWVRHNKFLINRGMDRSLAPKNPRLRMPSRRIDPKKRCPEFEQMAREVGFPKSQLRVVSYLMWKESRCQPDAFNKRDPKGGSRGLLQINGVWTKKLQKDGIINSVDDLYKPRVNLEAGYYVWSYWVNNTWDSFGWRPWGLR